MVPCGVESFSLDSTFGFVLFEQVESDAIENGEVLRGVAASDEPSCRRRGLEDGPGTASSYQLAHHPEVYTRAISATKREANDRVMQMMLEAGRKQLSAPSPAPSGSEPAGTEVEVQSGVGGAF